MGETAASPRPTSLPGVADIIIGLLLPVIGWILGRMFFSLLSSWVGPKMSALFMWVNLIAFTIAGIGLIMGNVIGPLVGTLISLVAAVSLSLRALSLTPREFGAVVYAFSMFVIPLGGVVYLAGGNVIAYVVWAADFLLASVAYFQVWRSQR